MDLNKIRENRYKIIKKYYPGLQRPEDTYFKEVNKRMNQENVVLEIGCGRNPGRGVQELTKQTKLFIGLDVSLLTLKVGRGICTPICGDAHFKPFKDCAFDLIFCRSVLEHVKYPDKLAKEIDRVLKPCGFFIFFTPNKWGYVSIFSRLIPDIFHGVIVRKIYNREEQDTFKTFYLANSKATLKTIFKETGLVQKKIIMMQQYPIELWFSLILLYFGIFFEKIVNKYDFLSFLRSNIIGCYQKKY